jgi:hypothetical protein
MVAGRLRDPLFGRDVMIGGLTGALTFAIYRAAVPFAAWKADLRRGDARRAAGGVKSPSNGGPAVAVEQTHRAVGPRRHPPQRPREPARMSLMRQRYDDRVSPFHPADTTPRAYELQFEKLRMMSPQQKGEILTALTLAVQDLALAGLRMQHPNEADDELRLRLAVRRLGAETVRRAYGHVPDEP